MDWFVIEREKDEYREIEERDKEIRKYDRERERERERERKRIKTGKMS